MNDRITIVVMTRDRLADLVTTLPRLLLAQPARVIVLDNGSRDATVPVLRARFPGVTVVPLGRNAGVGARNLGVELASTPYVAFADDDSWWTSASLRRVIEVFDEHPGIGALTGHVVVEPSGAEDPVTKLMRTSPVHGAPDLPGIPVLGFLACAAAVRRDAYLGVGGFCVRFHFGGEEQLLAADLAAAGWEIRYLPDAPVHHQPSRSRASVWRRRRDLRNTLWFLWLRRPWSTALLRSASHLHEAGPLLGLTAGCQAVLGLPWVLRERRRLPATVERSLALLDAQAPPHR